MQERLIKDKAIALLKDGTVNRVLGWKRGEFFYDVLPAVFETPEEIEKAEKGKKKKFEKDKKIALQVLAQDLKLLKEFSLTMRMERMMERFARMAPDDPEKLKLMEELGNLTRERAALRK